MSSRRHRSFSSNSSYRAAVGVILVFAALAVGGAHAETNLIVAAALVVTLLVFLLRRGHRELQVGLVAMLAICALAVTLIQLLPLPLGLLKIVSPGANDVISLDEARRWAPPSIDPPATAHEAIKVVAYVAAALLATHLFNTPPRRRLLLGWISASGTTVAVVGVVHGLARLDRPWGMFGPGSEERFISTFVNPNHLAAFLAFASIAGLGMATTARGRWRWVHLSSSLTTGAAVFLTLSRGGILAYVAALVFLGVAVAFRRSAARRGALWVHLLFAGVLLTAASFAHTRITHELWTLSYDQGHEKLAVWATVPDVVRDFPLLGVGRGAFGHIYPKYCLHEFTATVTHLENEWLQTVVDWGPVVGVAFIVAVCLAFAGVVREAAREPLALTGASVLVFLALHNLGDFNLAVTAVALPATMVLAGFSSSDRSAGWIWRSRMLAGRSAIAVPIGLSLVVLVCAWPAVAYRLDRDTKRFAGDLRSDEAEVVIRRHPGDYLLPLLYARRALEHDGPQAALPWLNRAMYLAPAYAPTHRLAGRALFDLGASSQAVLEYRLAAERAPGHAASLAAEVEQRSKGLELVARMGDSADLRVRLEVARFLLRRGASDRVVELLDEFSEFDAVELRARAHFELGALERALAHAEDLERARPDDYRGYVLQAVVHKRRKDFDAALWALDTGSRRGANNERLLRNRAHLLLSIGRLREARVVAQKWLEITPGSRGSADALWVIGRSYELDGRRALALREFERAREYNPRPAQYRRSIIRLRAELGDYPGAIREIEDTRVELGDAPEWQDLLETVEALRQAAPP